MLTTDFIKQISNNKFSYAFFYDNKTRKFIQINFDLQHHKTLWNLLKIQIETLNKKGFISIYTLKSLKSVAKIIFNNEISGNIHTGIKISIKLIDEVSNINKINKGLWLNTINKKYE